MAAAEKRNHSRLYELLLYLSGFASVEVKPMIFVVEARDPNDGATIMVVCRTRAEAVAAVAGFVRAGHQITKVTDRAGTIVRL
jgi:hypothetical protein